MLGEMEKALRPLVEAGQHVHWLAGVSGGADSTAMLHALASLRERMGLRLSVAHFDHRLRGRDEAKADLQHVQACADRAGLPLLLGSGDVAGQARRNRLSTEEAARRARHRFFHRTCRATGAQAVLLAHTRDDQAETVLLHLLRGAGASGLRGMALRTDMSGLVLLRPMLDITREQVLRYLAREGLTWREDPSNRDLSFTRNRVRHELLPLLAQHYQCAVRDVLARTGDLLRRDEEFLGQCARESFEACRDRSDPARLQVEALAGLHPALRGRVWILWLVEAGLKPGRVSTALLARLDDLLNREGERRVPLGDGFEVANRYGMLTVQTGEEGTPTHAIRVRLRCSGTTDIPALGVTVQMKRGKGYEKIPPPGVGILPAEAYLSAEKVGRAALYLRSRLDGDRLAPLGLRGSRKLQDILVDAKVPRSRRDRVPVLACRGQVVWVPGCRIARGWEVTGPNAPSLHIMVHPCKDDLCQ